MDMIGKKNLGAYFRELALTHADKTAIICEDAEGRISSLSYKNLDERIGQTANLLKGLGVKKGEFVAIHLLNSIEYVLALMAIAKLGAIAVPINANYVYADALFIIQKTKPVAVITQGEFVKIYEEIEEKNYKFKNGIILIKAQGGSRGHVDFDKEIKKQSTQLKEEEFSNLCPAEIIFTSGTSSFPKGVLITHYNLLFAGFYTSWQINLESSDIYLTAMPLWHIDAQCTVMMPTFSRGATLVILERFSARKFWDQIL